MENLFHLRMKFTEFNENENWTNNRADCPVFRVEIIDGDSVVGILYLGNLFIFHLFNNNLLTNCKDLFYRPGKNASNSTSSIAFSTNSNNWNIPKAAIICNFTGGIDKSLSFQNVTTLYHEFGHALHSLLSRTEYQHLAGVRAPPDFVEMPSTLMEHFLRDYNVVSLASSHYINKQVHK